MPPKKRPARKVIARAKDRRSQGDRTLPTASPIDYVLFEGNHRLPAGDPEAYLLTPASDRKWSDLLKEGILEELHTTPIDHIAPSSCMEWLQTDDRKWETKHKTLAILTMRICRGRHWLKSLQREFSSH